MFPRFLLPFGPNTLLTKESHSQELWKYTDTNGDGGAEKKELLDTGYGRYANVEHEESFLTWGLDNWMYSTVNAFRARWTPHGVIKEPTGSNGAQWGVSQDDDGKMWFQGGASGLPSYWQFPIVYGNFGGGRGAAEMDPDLGIPWGAPVRVADMQGGLSATRMPDGSLRSTTGAAGGDIVRAHRMPKDLHGVVDSTASSVRAREGREINDSDWTRRRASSIIRTPPHHWPSEPASASAPTRSCPPSAPAAWARCIGPTTASSVAMSRSRSCRPTSASIPRRGALCAP